MIIAVIGAGKIGEAVARRVSELSDVTKVFVTKRNISTIEHLRSGKTHVTRINKDAARNADVIILAVKAADAKGVLEEIADLVEGKLVISLMAAISIKVVRAMPNIAATVGEAITAYSLGDGLTKEDIRVTQSVFGSFGEYLEVPENLMDAVTALSGSGPAYIALLIEAMVSAGLKVGMPRDIASKLVIKTLTGTANLLDRMKMHPAELRDAVTTPAGTTIAGIYELEKGSIRTSMMNAVEAATRQAKEVAGKFDEERH
ncbi:MAG: pyrroline-5-carboxylate reductase [Thaumarchaeota archaeon]|nr:MAG: pyrroline-5-carboxylate reductase [Nitrososphaerota archaeon]